MNTHADKTQENKSQSAANAATQKHSGEPTFQFVDNRPEAVAQRKLQEMASNSPQANQLVQLKLMFGYEPTNMVEQKGEVAQCVLDGAVDSAVKQPMRAGLYHGAYFRAVNKADLHVDAAEEEGQHATKAELKALLQEINQAMITNHAATGTVGIVEWHPTGAAVVKQVIELLGSAAGSYLGILRALYAKRERKKAMQEKAKPDRKAGDMHPSMIPEHIAYMKAMQGKEGISVKARLMSDNGDYRQWCMDNPEATEEEKAGKLEQVIAASETNMLDDSEAGKQRLISYQESLRDGMPASLDINIAHTRLPAIIGKL